MADESRALVPIEQRSVDFYGDTLTGYLVEFGGERRMYVAVKPISDYLGLSWAAQYRRIQRDPVLSTEMELIAVTAMNSPRRGRPDSTCLPVEFVHGWLFGISADRVKPELRDRVILYQRECYRVLARAFGAPAPAEPAVQFTPDLVLSFSAFMRDTAHWQIMLDRNQAAIDRRVRALEEGRAAPEKRKTLPPAAEE